LWVSVKSVNGEIFEALRALSSPLPKSYIIVLDQSFRISQNPTHPNCIQSISASENLIQWVKLQNRLVDLTGI